MKKLVVEKIETLFNGLLDNIFRPSHHIAQSRTRSVLFKVVEKGMLDKFLKYVIGKT